jgi:Tol biopolymer transport system component
MKDHVIHIAIALLVVSAMLVQISNPVDAASTSKRIAELAGHSNTVSTDGTFVVWDDRVDGAQWADVFVADLRDRTVTRVSEPDPNSHNHEPDVSDGVVVWTEEYPTLEPPVPSRIRGKNLVTGESFTIAESETDHRHPAIDGQWVTWLHNTGTTDEDGTPVFQIMLRDIQSMEPAVAIAEVHHPETRLFISAGFVVWVEPLDSSRMPPVNVFSYRISTNKTQLVLDRFPSQWDVVVGGSLLAYREYLGNDAYRTLTLDLSTGDQREVTITGRIVATDGRYIVSVSAIGELDPLTPTTHALHAFDTVSGLEFVIDQTDTELGAYRKVAASNGVVVWADFRAIYAADLHALLNSAPRPAPDDTSPNWLYFPETGHYLSYGFKDYWQRNGGLPVFGFPLTEEFTEFNADLGLDRTVQYLERQRFEYHPELAGTPYETLLGRLGFEDAERRGLFEHPAFKKLPFDTQSDQHSDFFPVTGHRISHGFRNYWRSHGLDLGDAGVSYRESVGLFGYPISEEFVDPRTGLVTQYFERAVFEYHPDNPDPHKILLRRLGAEEMVRRGWRIEEQPRYERIAFTADGEIFTIREDGTALANLTVNPGWDDDPVWSPDGTKIAFFSDRNPGGIHVMNADGTRVRNLTPETGGVLPAWSPDGKSIAYIANDHLYAMRSDGTDHRRISGANVVSSNSRPSWSADNTRIAYEVDYLDERGWFDKSVIHVVHADGTGDMALTLDLDEAVRPAWSPDGSLIAFVHRQDVRTDQFRETLMVMNPDGSNKRAWNESGAGDRIFPYAWSPDSNQIAAHFEPGGFERHDSQIILASDYGQRTIFTGDDPLTIAWAPDALRIAFYQSGQIWVINWDSGELRALTDPDVIFVGGGDIAWAPKATR